MSKPRVHNPLSASSFYKIRESIRDVEGWLTPREAEFLAIAAANPTAEGEILEFGSFQGKSTIVMAMATRLSGQSTPITTIDFEKQAELEPNLFRAGVHNQVKTIHSDSSSQIAKWDRPLRMVFFDGANDVKTVTSDVHGILPWVNDRGILAFHDVLNRSGDRVKVFIDTILGNPQIGAAGICGSLGWAQYCKNPMDTKQHTELKAKLANKLQRLWHYHTPSRRQSRISRTQYKLLRALVPHGDLKVNRWLHLVA